MTTDVDGDELGRLLAARGGFLAFGLWNLVVRLAATCSRRGVLIKDGLPMPVEYLAGLAQLPVSAIERALELLASPEIGLIERVPLDQALVPAKVLEPLFRPFKIQPLKKCPVCSADLTGYIQVDTAVLKKWTLGAAPVGLEKGSDPTPDVTGATGSPNQCERSESEATVSASVTTPESSESLRSHRFEEPVPASEEPAAPTVGVRDQTDERGADDKPRPTWLKPTTLSKATWREAHDVHLRFQRGELTIADVAHYIDTHYFDENEVEDDEDSNEDEEYWDEDAWDEDLRTDIPPPVRRESG